MVSHLALFGCGNMVTDICCFHPLPTLEIQKGFYSFFDRLGLCELRGRVVYHENYCLLGGSTRARMTWIVVSITNRPFASECLYSPKRTSSARARVGGGGLNVIVSSSKKLRFTCQIRTIMAWYPGQVRLTVKWHAPYTLNPYMLAELPFLLRGR